MDTFASKIHVDNPPLDAAFFGRHEAIPTWASQIGNSQGRGENPA